MRNALIGLVLVIGIVFFSFKDSIKAAGNLNEGAWETFLTIWDKWEKSEGDIVYATTWEEKVDDGVSFDEVLEAIKDVGIEANMRLVGELPLGKELKARGVKSGRLYVVSYCAPDIARKMVDFSAAAAAYLPCRISIVEREDGLWLYTLNMDMMIKLGKVMSPELLKDTLWVRQTIWDMMQAGKTGG